jgi:hypothetical protein
VFTHCWRSKPSKELLHNLPEAQMNQADKDTLKRLRNRIDEGEEFNQTLLARYNDLVAQEAREEGKSSIICFHSSSSPCFCLFLSIFILYSYMLIILCRFLLLFSSGAGSTAPAGKFCSHRAFCSIGAQ